MPSVEVGEEDQRRINLDGKEHSGHPGREMTTVTKVRSRLVASPRCPGPDGIFPSFSGPLRQPPFHLSDHPVISTVHSGPGPATVTSQVSPPKKGLISGLGKDIVEEHRNFNKV